MLAHTQSLDLAELRRAIEAKRLISNIEPFDHFDIPADWTRTYARTAKGVPLATGYTAMTAALLVASFVDPAFDKNSNTATWDPQALAWSEPASVPRAYSADSADSG